MSANGRHIYRNVRLQPLLVAAWVRAEEEGKAWVLVEYVLGQRAHFGYDPSEVPEYGPCVCCLETVRVDRLDLIAEHLSVCRRFTPGHLREAI